MLAQAVRFGHLTAEQAGAKGLPVELVAELRRPAPPTRRSSTRLGTVVRVLSRGVGDPRGDQVVVQWDGTVSGYRWADPADGISVGDRVVAVGEQPPRRVVA